MKKHFTIFTGFLFILVLIGSALFAKSSSFIAHKKYKRNGTQVIKRCSYCHNSETKLLKKSGQNYKALFKTKTCAGKGCH